MAKEYKKLADWVELLGYNPSVWIGGDWHQPMHLLSKLLIEQLSERRPLENIEKARDVSFKISFDSMTELAEENLGIPALVTEKDLMINFPNIFLAQLVQLIAFKHTLEKSDIDRKHLAEISAPKLVFEARNGMDAQFPRCPSCHEHVFFLERVIVEKTVWHRQCLKCVVCGEKLKAGTFKKTKIGHECLIHSIRKILDEKEQKKSPRPTVPPPPVPTLASLSVSDVSKEHDNYESLDIELTSTVSDITASSKRSSMTMNLDTRKERKPKPLPPPKPKHLSSYMFVQDAHMDPSNNSSDSGVSVSSHHYDVVEDPKAGELKYRLDHPSSGQPVAPPRPKRASMLLTSAMVSPPACQQTSIFVKTSSSSTPKTETPHPNPRNIAKESSLLNKELYPNDLNPFDEADELKVNFDYDESKNPFADSSDDEIMPTPAPRKTIPASLLPGESDRPKSLPPPPPAEVLEEETNNKLQTLRISRKKRRAPLPPNLRRTIAFTENQKLEDASIYEERVRKLDEDVTRVELESKKIEMELLLKISTNPKDWYKLPRTEDYILTAQKLFDIRAEQCRLLYSWKEAFLNEIHSETDFLLRTLVEKDLKDEYSIMREKQLLRLLVDIMDEKAKLTESHLDGSESKSRDSSLVRKEKKKTKMLRMALLSNKIRNKKK